MSDDEYYDSPYDEFEEMLWDADPAPHLADDLAQHAGYSPVWQDDPIGELDAYHSDWEYYSDDYFDDDPAILRINPVDGSVPQGGSKKDTRSTRGRKRKIDEVADAIEGPEAKSLRSALRGTVWADSSVPPTKIFHRGRQEKVALLVDWRERFQLGQSKQRSPLRTLKRDESWANDMSLDDMGLKGIRERPGTEQNVVIEEDNIDEDTGDEAGVEFLEESETAMEGVDTFDVDSEEQSDHGVIPDHAISNLGDQLDVDVGRLRKTNSEKFRRWSQASSKLRDTEPSGNTEDGHQLKMSEDNRKSTRQPAKAGKSVSRLRGNVASAGSGNAADRGQRNGTLQRKRRLSSSSEESSKATDSAMSSRAKRVASRRLESSQKDNTSTKHPIANTRSSKARKS